MVLYQNVKLTSDEIKVLEDLIFNNPEIGTKSDYVNIFGEKSLVNFIRSINGLDPSAVRQSFSNFINNYQLRSDQIEFINKIINHFERNGMLELSELTNPPYTDINDQGIFIVFDKKDQNNIINIITKLNNVC